MNEQRQDPSVVPGGPGVVAAVAPRRGARTWRVLLLVGVDLAALAVAGVLGYWLWARGVLNVRPGPYLRLVWLAPVFILANGLWGLYPGFGLGAVETLRRLTLASSSIFLSLAAVSFALKLPYQYSRMTLGLTWIAALCLLPLFRFSLLTVVRRWSWWGERCLVVGTGELAERTVKAMGSALSLGYRPWGLAATRPVAAEGERFGLPVLGSVEDVAKLAMGGVRVALVAVESPEEAGQLVEQLRHVFRQVFWIRDHRGLPVEGLEVRNFGPVIGVEFVNQLQRRRNRLLKRSVDLALGSVAGLVALPVVAVSALLVRLSSRGPAFYQQDREGLLGQGFRLTKLRTMEVDAEARLEQHLESDPAAREEWSARRKLSRDPRVIPGVGKWMRRFSLDELPQLFHVVRGEMSLVGPRPFPEYHLASFPREFRELRQRVRPGLTGLWQVMVRSAGTTEEQVAFDAYYIRNWSLWLDLYILARTVAAVLRGRGAY